MFRNAKEGRMKTASRLVVLAAIAAAGCASDMSQDKQTGNGATPRPSFIQGPVSANFYDGSSNDLLTTGLGKSGLQLPAPPPYVDPLKPTAAELRRNTIYANYRALVDMTPAGGYGVLYGPNIDLEGNDRLGEGTIAGNEYIAYADDGSGKQNVTMMVQVPKSFDPANPCIVT